MDTRDLGRSAERNMATMAFASGGLAIATATAAYKTVNTVPYMVNGRLTSKAATDPAAGVAWPNTYLTVKDGALVPNGAAGATQCLFVVALDFAGAFKVFQGALFKAEVVGGVTKYRAYRTYLNDSGVRVYEMTSQLVDYMADLLPAVDDGYCPVGIIKIVTNAADFVPGTTALTGIATYHNVGALPAGINL